MAETLGVDYSWVDDATDGRMGVATSVGLAYLQSLARRLMTPNGSVPFWKDYGTDLRQYVLGDTPEYIIGSAAENECYKDERTQTATATVVRRDGELEVTLAVESDVGNLVFVMTVNEAELKLVSVQGLANG